MYRILAYISDDEFANGLHKAVQDGRVLEQDAVDLDIVHDAHQALDLLADKRFDAVLVGDAAAELQASVRQSLLSAGGSMQTAVFAVGGVTFEELHDSAHLGSGDDVGALLEALVAALVRAHGMNRRPESSSYFVRETQGGPYAERADASRGHAHSTSQLSVDGQGPPRLMYVGEPSDFRDALEDTATTRGIELVLFDRPRQVTVRAGDPAIDLAVISVDGELKQTRRLIRFLRSRQPQATFDLILLARNQDDLGTGLARSFGANAVLEHPVPPNALLQRVRQYRLVDRSTMLVVAGDDERVEFFQNALVGEPVDAVYVSEVDAAVELFETCVPEIVLVDQPGGAETGLAITERLRDEFPFASTRYLAVVEHDAPLEAAARAIFDDVLDKPIDLADVRRIVRVHLSRASYGRTQLERDRLTDVNSTLVLADDLQAQIDRVEGSHTSVVLTAVDVDDLAKINERYGRPVGDSVLRSLADALHVAVGERSVLYRTGGDEFFVLQQATAAQWPELRAKLERALAVFQQQTFRAPDGRGTYATASAGTVVVPPVNVSAEVCLQKCWIVLERATSTLRNRLLVAQLDPSMLAPAVVAHDGADGQD